MKPVIVLPLGLMKEEDIAELRKNDFCVVECKEPAKVKFIDPIPCQSSRTEIENAAIKLSRVIINGEWKKWWNSETIGQSGAAHVFCQLLIGGTPLDSRGDIEEQKKKAYELEVFEETRRIAREDARNESKAKKEAAKKLLEEQKKS